jgi:hypothetical protein
MDPSNLRGYSVTQKKIMDVLSDGHPHSMESLRSCLWDELGSRYNVARHITRIRRIIEPHGEDIICQYLNMGYYYRHVILLNRDAIVSSRGGDLCGS